MGSVTLKNDLYYTQTLGRVVAAKYIYGCQVREKAELDSVVVSLFFSETFIAEICTNFL